MSNKPLELSNQEKLEIANMKEIRDMWGAETAKEFVEYLEHTIYSVKFDFTSGSPGFCGDLITMYGDALAKPLTLIRNAGVLEVVELE